MLALNPNYEATFMAAIADYDFTDNIPKSKLFIRLDPDITES